MCHQAMHCVPLLELRKFTGTVEVVHAGSGTSPGASPLAWQGSCHMMLKRHLTSLAAQNHSRSPAVVCWKLPALEAFAPAERQQPCQSQACTCCCMQHLTLPTKLHVTVWRLTGGASLYSSAILTRRTLLSALPHGCSKLPAAVNWLAGGGYDGVKFAVCV